MDTVNTSVVRAIPAGLVHHVISWSAMHGAQRTGSAQTVRASVNQGGMDATVLEVSQQFIYNYSHSIL